jgi:hypothetical protein
MVDVRSFIAIYFTTWITHGSSIPVAANCIMSHIPMSMVLEEILLRLLGADGAFIIKICM